MARPAKMLLTAAAALAAAVVVSGCGTQGINVPKSSPYRTGAVLFVQHCSGCHTMSLVGADGSASSIQNRLPTNGPNFDFRQECVQDVLYAIRNGGFSGAIMPENIVVGPQAQAIAEFLHHYAGYESPKTPSTTPPESCST